MIRFFCVLIASSTLTVNTHAQSTMVRAPLVVAIPDKQFDSVAMNRREGHLRVIVRSLDDPTFLLDGVRASATSLASDTARAKRALRTSDTKGMVDFGALPVGEYLMEGTRIASQAVTVLVPVRAGCHTVVEIYLTYQRRQNDMTIDAPTTPRATITTCPNP